MAADPCTVREVRHLYPQDEPLHIVGRDWHFEWHQGEINKVIKLWNGGYSLPVIARRVDSSTRDTFLLLMELAEKGKIKGRAGYLWGEN